MLLHSLPHAAPPYHEVIITTDPLEGPYFLGSTVILRDPTSTRGSDLPLDWFPSFNYLVFNSTLTIPAHHPSQGHYYFTVSNGSSVLAVGITTMSVRGELDTSSLLLLHALTQASLASQTLPVPLCRLLSACSMCTDTKSNWCCGMERVWLARLKTSIYTTVYNCECMRLTLVSDVYTNHIKELATVTQLWLHHELFSLAKYLPMAFELKM